MRDSFVMVLEKQPFPEIVSDVLQLCKIRISLFLGLSALCGHMLFRPVFNSDALFSAWAVFILSCGCATLNNLQDRSRDASSARTRYRALPDKRITPGYAFLQSAVFITIGLLLMMISSNSHIPVLLGVLAVIFYNGLYTPMKTLCLVSFVPGIFCGMIPPLIGWTLAGGGMPDLKMSNLMMVFGFWQLPRLGLVNLSRLREFSLEEARGLWGNISVSSLRRMVVFWVFSLSLMLNLLVMQDVLISSASHFLVVFHSVCLCLVFLIKLRDSKLMSEKDLFVHLNASLVWLMILIVSERLLLFP